MSDSIECVIFDCDGTLVDSEHLCALGWSTMLAAYGVDIAPEAMQSRYAGKQFSLILSELCEIYNLVVACSFEQEYREIVSGLFDTQLKQIEGVENALAKIDLPKCVASNGPPKKIRHALGVCGLEEYFGDNLFSAYDIGIWKPDSRFLLYACGAMGFQPKNCALVDDTLVGIDSGVKSGVRPFYYNPGRLINAPDEVVSFDAMIQLPDLLQQ